MRYAPEDEEEAPSVRRLRRLVMALMLVLMLSILTIAATIVIRLGFGGGSGPVNAESLQVPPGELVGMGQGEGTVLFLIRDADGTERLHVFDDSDGGAPISSTIIERK